MTKNEGLWHCQQLFLRILSCTLQCNKNKSLLLDSFCFLNLSKFSDSGFTYRTGNPKPWGVLSSIYTDRQHRPTCSFTNQTDCTANTPQILGRQLIKREGNVYFNELVTELLLLKQLSNSL